MSLTKLCFASNTLKWSVFTKEKLFKFVVGLEAIWMSLLKYSELIFWVSECNYIGSAVIPLD